MDKQFKLQNRYQDSGWEDFGGTNRQNDIYEDESIACGEALEFSKNSMFYGMLRVVELGTKNVIATYTAGKKV